MVPLGTGQTEDPFLEDRVHAVPEREREAEQLMVVTDAAESILTPAECARPSVIVGKGVPGVAVGTVVLAHGSPGALAEIRPPAQPGGTVLTKPRALGVLGAHVSAAVSRGPRHPTRRAR